MYKLAVVFGTYNRGHLLWRSLERYAAQTFDMNDVQFIVLDDWSMDHTDEMLREYAKRLNIVTIRPPYKQPGTWRDSAAIMNIGIRAAHAEFIILTHPEVIPGNDALAQIWENRGDMRYVCCKPYYLTPGQQERIDSVDWNSKDGVLALRNLDRFYEDSAPIAGGPDYSHATIEAAQVWESWVFGGYSRETLKFMGGIAETSTWGSIDLSSWGRRQVLGIENITLTDERTLCAHQNHDDPRFNMSPTPRIMEHAQRDAGYWTPENARLKHL